MSDQSDTDPDTDLFSSPPDLELARDLISLLHRELPGMVGRYRYLRDISVTLGSHGTMLFGMASGAALGEARSSFVNGNYVATILLCQSIAEHALAGALHMGTDAFPSKITFGETLERCEAQGLIRTTDVKNFKKLANLRNPLSHYRSGSDPAELMRRSMAVGETADELLRRDAHFAIALIIELLSGAPFRVG